MSKKLKIAIALLVLIVAGYFVVRVIFKSPFQYAGTVEATRIDLPARLSTVIKAINVTEGQQIKKDEVLAQLSCEELEVSRSLVNESYERSLKLKNAGSISKEAFDQALNKKQDNDLRWEWCQIKSPVSGTVLTRFLEPSEWVNPGMKVLTVADLTDLWAYFYVPQEVMSKLRVGSEVTGQVPELGKTYRGTIIKINDEAEFTPKNVQTQSERSRLIFGIKISFKNTDGSLKPGMTIESPLEGKGQ